MKKSFNRHFGNDFPWFILCTFIKYSVLIYMLILFDF